MGVLDKFTKRAKQVLSFAQEEAGNFNHPYVGTEHILLGLIRDQEGVPGKLLDELGVKLQQARGAVEFIVGRGAAPRPDEAEMTARTRKVLKYAVEEARKLNHHSVGTEHLLLGLARDRAGVAAGVLETMGVSLEQIRAGLQRYLHRGPAGDPMNLAPGQAAADDGASFRQGVVTYPQHRGRSRWLIVALSSAVLVWWFVRRRTAVFRTLPEFVEERIVLPMGGLVRPASGSRQESNEVPAGRMTRKVGRNLRISVGGKLYGPLDQELVGQQVEVEERDGRIVVWSGSTKVASFDQQL